MLKFWRTLLCVSFLLVLAMLPVPQATVRTFNVTAHQWAFDVAPGGQIVVNQGDEVVLQIKSTDVIHGFSLSTYAPQSIDLLPGTTREIRFVANKAGTFSYFCTNFCGTGHADMRGTMTVNPAPSLSVASVSPASGPESGGTTVTISGAGFAAGATVSFGGSPATNVAVTNSTSLTAITPGHAPGTVSVTVTNTNGSAATRAAGFTFLAGPTSIALAPSSGPSGGNTSVTITGSGFQSGARVAFGDVEATIVTVTATSITAISPPHAAGTVAVVVTNPDGQSATLPGAFTYIAFEVSAIAPAAGPVAGGTPFVIIGSGFLAGASVTFGGIPAVGDVVVDAGRITGTTPSHAAAVVDVIVRNPDGQIALLSSGFRFASAAHRQRAIRR
jgi:hypothetical protein